MVTRVRFRAACIVLACCGCAPIQLQPLVSKVDRPVATNGYVAGIFSSDRGSGFAFVLCDDAGSEYRMPFGNGKVFARREMQAAMVALPPGTYAIRFWQTYALNREPIRTQALAPASPLGRTFEVKSGRVVVLGSFATTTTFSFGRTDWTIRPQPLSAGDAEAAIRREYPAFQAAPVSCLLCDGALGSDPEARR